MKSSNNQNSLLIVKALSDIDISTNKQFRNIEQLIIDVQNAGTKTQDAVKRAQVARSDVEDNGVISNWWNDRGDHLKRANENLAYAVADLSEKSSNLLIMNVAISSQLYNQQQTLNDQQSNIKRQTDILSDQQTQLGSQQSIIKNQQDELSKANKKIEGQQEKLYKQQKDIEYQQNIIQNQTNELAEQGHKIYTQQVQLTDAFNRIELQQKEINKAHNGLLEAKGVSAEQASKLVGIVQTTELLEVKIKKENQVLTSNLLQKYNKLEDEFNLFVKTTHGQLSEIENDFQDGIIKFQNENMSVKNNILFIEANIFNKIDNLVSESNNLLTGLKDNIVLLDDKNIAIEQDISNRFLLLEDKFSSINTGIDELKDKEISIFAELPKIKSSFQEEIDLLRKETIDITTDTIINMKKFYNLQIVSLWLFIIVSLLIIGYLEKEQIILFFSNL